jgi:hypothetical protein
MQVRHDELEQKGEWWMRLMVCGFHHEAGRR